IPACVSATQIAFLQHRHIRQTVIAGQVVGRCQPVTAGADDHCIVSRLEPVVDPKHTRLGVVGTEREAKQAERHGGMSGKKLNTEDLLINPSDNDEYYATFFLCRKHWVMHRKSRGGITISPLIPWQIKIMNAADLHPGLRAPLLKLEQQILQ